MFTLAQDGLMLVVEPESCLQDEPVSIRASGLQPGQHVTFQAAVTDTRGVEFMSYAHYIADEQGAVDVGKMDSKGGHYKGHVPMGLIGSLVPSSNDYKFTRFFKRDVENPNEVKVSIHGGHLSAEKLCPSDPALLLASVTHLRHYMGPGVQRIPVRYGKVRGCLFLPQGAGPFPGVVDMFGTAGGLLEYRSAQLASRGFASLALAFFGYEDLPISIEEFDISYFEKAVEFLLNHEKILKPHVGAIGMSKGGDLALSMATFIPEVKAGVSINGCNANVLSKLNLHNGSLPGLEFDIRKAKIEDGVLNCHDVLADPADYPETIIPIEKADANFLFLVGCADLNWNSEKYADMAVKRLQQAGRNNYEVHKYAGAGHILEPPHAPHAISVYHKLVRMPMLVGGSLKQHLQSQPQAWNTLMNFLRKCVR